MGNGRKILVVSHDIIGPQMAGPGIRYWALANVLAHHFEVALAAPQGSELVREHAHVENLVIYNSQDHQKIVSWLAWADVVLIPGDIITDFPQFLESDTPVVMDGYDPHTAENLMWNAPLPLEERARSYNARHDLISQQCLAGDFFICASERQRTWWLGLLEAHGRVNPYTFDEDPALCNLIDVVPFALPSQPFSHADIDIPEIAPEDKVLLWGGGLWEWLDPLTVIRAMPRILEDFPQAKLLFPGTRHPNPAVPAMRKVEEAKVLVAELRLQDVVIFGDWVPREAWNAYLARADVGLSLHPDTYETHLAYRSRLLDYIWAGLPMVVTRGDETSKLVSRFQLGRVVDYEDVEGVAVAISDVLARPQTAFSAGFAEARQTLTWETAAQPLIAFCRAPRRAPDKEALGDRMGNHYYEKQHQALREDRARLTQQQAHLQTLVSGYEQGKFIRLMKWLHSLVGRG